MHFFFDIFDKEIIDMKYSLLFWFLSLTVIVSCGKDNDDFVLPEDVSNINLEKGITFGVFELNCTSNCATIYVSSNNGVFSTDTNATTVSAPEDFVIFDCPISEQNVFIAQTEGIQNVPRGLRDIPSKTIEERIGNTKLSRIYMISYTLNNGTSKTIPFLNGSNSDRQISEYYSSVINIIENLEGLDTTPTDCKK